MKQGKGRLDLPLLTLNTNKGTIKKGLRVTFKSKERQRERESLEAFRNIPEHTLMLAQQDQEPLSMEPSKMTMGLKLT